MASLDGAYDYIVVGAGAGGGPLAARLAEKGHRVLLMDAGGDPADPATADVYSVPGFHARCAEDPGLRWDFFVDHYARPQEPDSKYDAKRGGILYPRASTLGGCSAHNHLVAVYGHDADWDRLARRMNDPSFASARMRGYFQRLERCLYRPRPMGARTDRARHGFDGWLGIELADWRLALKDFALVMVLLAAARRYAEGGQLGWLGKLRGWLGCGPVLWRLIRSADINDARSQGEGMFLVPQTTLKSERSTCRELIRDTQAAFPGNLTVANHVLVTRLKIPKGSKEVKGVHYVEGADQYRADRDPVPKSASAGREKHVDAKKEVILCGGTFNSPQLLMLSGIGPEDELKRHKIKPVEILDGVGKNLHDRYEVGIVSRMKRSWRITEGAAFEPPQDGRSNDPAWRDWQNRRGLYTTHGLLTGLRLRSSVAGNVPDLFIFGFPADFRGYEVGFSERIANVKDHMSWIILKAQSRNRAGRLRLASVDPRDPPKINFEYFEPLNDPENLDLQALTEGVRFVRDIAERTWFSVAEEVWPGKECKNGIDIGAFIKREAWGHHACGTCAMGTDSAAGAVVDSSFRVHGVKRLRVVDASVFRDIPGYFVMVPVYMISEKAADVIDSV